MKNNKILIADKDRLTEKWLSALLAKEGYDVKTASTGAEFLEKLESEQPSLTIIDPDFPDMKFTLVHDVISINPYTANIPIIILSDKDDPNVISTFFEKGISDYIVKRPQIENEILGKCLRFFREGGKTQVDSESGQIISFFSPKGGIGVSTLCLNMAHFLAHKVSPQKILVVDMVLPLGSLGLMTGTKQKGSLAQLTTESGAYTTRILDKYISHSPAWDFSILEGSLTPDDALALIPPKVEPLFDALKQNYDYLFVEMGKTLSRISIPILQKSDLIVIVTGSDPVSVELTQSSLSYLYDIGINKRSLFVILNRATGREGFSRNEITKVLEIPVEMTVPYADTNFNISTNQHKPYDVVHRSDSITMSLKDLTTKLFNRMEEKEEA